MPRDDPVPAGIVAFPAVPAMLQKEAALRQLHRLRQPKAQPTPTLLHVLQPQLDLQGDS